MWIFFKFYETGNLKKEESLEYEMIAKKGGLKKNGYSGMSTLIIEQYDSTFVLYFPLMPGTCNPIRLRALIYSVNLNFKERIDRRDDKTFV